MEPQQAVIADEDFKVVAGPFFNSDEIRDYCFKNRVGLKNNKTVWTLFILDTPPEMYRVIDGTVVSERT